MLLRKQFVTCLLEAGATEAEAKAMALATAAARHQWRAEAALKAAQVGWKGDHALWAWAVLSADGIGSVTRYHDLLPSGATVRLPQLRGLGKGRKQASDGRAWSAAITAAANMAAIDIMGRGFSVPVQFHPGKEGDLLAGCGASVGHFTVSVTEALPPSWREQIARMAIAMAAGYPDYSGGAIWAPPESLPDWLAVYRQATSEEEQGRPAVVPAEEVTSSRW